MKRYIFTALVVLALGAGVVLAQDHHKKVEAGKLQKAKVEFTETIKLLDVMLRGEYLFVHDDEKMAKGLDCTYVYDSAGKLLVSFHCEPIERVKTDQFKVLVTTKGNVLELEEYQFAGSTEAHRVPRAE
jgi:hypothetical protein